MRDQGHDFELLQRFTRNGEQSAFADVVRRHLDLVFATALRKVADAGVAQEISQNVFSVLARKAWRFAPDDSLPAWLHKTALLESKSWLRGELRRRRREETAAQLGTTMRSSEEQSAFSALVPLLDDALLSLREKDRTALLLRYYEKQSLRDVGAAFGVSEDTAQKRVQSALEKLSEFFKQRGFKTATVAATAAVLQHTAVSTSATVISTVVGAAMQVAPPALVGLGALIARLASLTRIQTAAVCVAVVAAPVAWQWKELRQANDEVRQMRAQFVTAQTDATNAQADIERLQTDSAKLEQSIAQANEVAARAAASAQAFADWKQKIRAPLLAANYRWDDNSPFVRIPKAVLPDLSEVINVPALSPPGVVNPYARELLGLTAAERQAVEQTLQRVEKLQRGEKADAYEKDEPVSGRTVARRAFKNQPPGEVGPEAEQRFAQMLAELRGIFGEDRWPVLPSRFRSVNCDALNRILIPEPNATLTATVENDENGSPQAKWMYTGNMPTERVEPPSDGAPSGNVYSVNVVGYKKGSAALSSFLSVGDINESTNVAGRLGSDAPEAFRLRAAAWFAEQAKTRLVGKENP